MTKKAQNKRDKSHKTTVDIFLLKRMTSKDPKDKFNYETW